MLPQDAEGFTHRIAAAEFPAHGLGHDIIRGLHEFFNALPQGWGFHLGQLLHALARRDSAFGLGERGHAEFPGHGTSHVERRGV